MDYGMHRNPSDVAPLSARNPRYKSDAI